MQERQYISGISELKAPYPPKGGKGEDDLELAPIPEGDKEKMI
jgi:hypothetical protein